MLGRRIVTDHKVIEAGRSPAVPFPAGKARCGIAGKHAGSCVAFSKPEFNKMDFKEECTSESAAILSVISHYFRVTFGLGTGKSLRALRSFLKQSRLSVSSTLGESAQDEQPTEYCSGCEATKVLWIFLYCCFSFGKSK